MPSISTLDEMLSRDRATITADNVDIAKLINDISSLRSRLQKCLAADSPSPSPTPKPSPSPTPKPSPSPSPSPKLSPSPVPHPVPPRGGKKRKTIRKLKKTRRNSRK